MTESGEFVHVFVAVSTQHDDSEGEMEEKHSRSENCDAGEKSLKSWSMSKKVEMKSSVAVADSVVVAAVAVAVVGAVAVAVLVAISEVVAGTAVEVLVFVVITPASPAERGHPEILKLWKRSFFGVFKEAVSLSR